MIEELTNYSCCNKIPNEVAMNLEAFFKPETMAVIGVSATNDRHPANVIYNKNLHRYPVRVYPVNRRGGLFQGQRVFTGISELPEAIDLAVIAVRAEYVPEVLSDCIESGVKAAAIISGGFAETGRRDLQDRLAGMAREAKFPFMGPNCLGIYRPHQADTFFLPAERMVQPRAGHIALVSQSGGILVDQMIKFTEEEIGLSAAVSIGNKALLRETDLLDFFCEDDGTKVVVFYVEGFGKNEGREFVQAARNCPKPVVVIKAGKSQEGGRAVSSHTASLAGDYDVFSSALSQYGIMEARSERELVSYCEALLSYPRAITGKAGIITCSGGHGAMAVDNCATRGISVPALSDHIQKEIRSCLSHNIRAIASVANPVDLTGSAVDDDFVAAGDYLSGREEIDCLLYLMLPYLPGVTSDVGARLGQICKKKGKPMIAYVPLLEKYRMLIDGFELNGIPVSGSIEGAVNMVEALRRPDL